MKYRRRKGTPRRRRVTRRVRARARVARRKTARGNRAPRPGKVGYRL